MSRKLDRAPEASFGPVAACFESVELAPSDGAARLVSLAVPAGSAWFIVGAPGSGKSAAIDLLSFEGRPRRGRVEVLGTDLSKVAPASRAALRRRVGVMFQDLRLLPDLSAFDNVALAARIAGQSPRDYHEPVTELLAWVGLGARAVEPPGRLTEGERRRLALARALINRPEILLADEPTAGLGPKAASGLLKLIRDVHASGTTVVVATRDRELARAAGGEVMDLSVGEWT